MSHHFFLKTRLLAAALLPITAALAAPADPLMDPPKIEIKDVATRYKTHGDFQSIGEFFTGRESKPTVLERSNPDSRQGMYFIIDLTWRKKGSLMLATQIEIDYVRSDDALPRKAVFYLDRSRSTFPEMQFGLTGEDWPGKNVQVLAYKVSIRQPLGELIAEKESFLWRFPDAERQKMIAEGRGAQLQGGKLMPESDLKRPAPVQPAPDLTAQADTRKDPEAPVVVQPVVSTQTIEKIERAANAGDPQGLVALGVLYLKGIGRPADTPKALELLKQAADKGNTDAQYNLGLMYSRGEGTAPNADLALSYFTQAAQFGHIKAQYNLGYLYSYSGDITPDGKQAAFWYQRAAGQGFQPAQYNLAFLLTRGDAGAAMNLQDAYYWALISAQGKNAEAEALAKKISGMLPKEQKRDVEQAAKEFLPTKETPAAETAQSPAAQN